jgi:hypothetical protein
MEKERKDVYVPPHVTVRQIRWEQGFLAQASPVSVMLMDDAVTQDGDWDSDLPEESSEGGIWVAF